MAVSSHERLKSLVQKAIDTYGESNNKDPVWFPYGKVDASNKFIQQYPTFANVLGITDEALFAMVSRRSFSSLRNHFIGKFEIRKENMHVFIMISGDSKKLLGMIQ